MKKKLLIILSLLFITVFLTISCCFANNIVTDVKQGASSLVNGARDSVGYAENTIEGAVKDVGNAISGTTTFDRKNPNDYTSARTAATTNTLTTNNMFWTWVVLAIAAVIIVSLVWYYGNQKDNKID